MKYSGPLLSDGDALSEAAVLALLGEAWDGDDELWLEPAVHPVVPLPLVNLEALRLYTEHFVIAGLLLLSFAGAAMALLR